MQTKTHSLIEVLTNIAVGYTINITANFIIFPLWGWEITLKQNIEIGVIYTVLALARGFCLRRVFTYVTERQR